jgi:hypothetical protein
MARAERNRDRHQQTQGDRQPENQPALWAPEEPGGHQYFSSGSQTEPKQNPGEIQSRDLE